MGSNCCYGTTERAYESRDLPEIGEPQGRGALPGFITPSKKRKHAKSLKIKKESSEVMTKIDKFLKKHVLKELVFEGGHASLVESYACQKIQNFQEKIVHAVNISDADKWNGE